MHLRSGIFRMQVISLTLVVLIVEGPILSSQANYNLPQPGPSVIASKGEVWPHPLKIQSNPDFFTITPLTFKFEVITQSAGCLIIQKAVTRYSNILVKESTIFGDHSGLEQLKQTKNYAGPLNSLKVHLLKDCDVYPHSQMDEAYKITVNGADSKLVANSTWGILRGLETFVQLAYPVQDGSRLFINKTVIEDEPRFKHRGLLLDTARHFIPVRDILLELDAMAAVKMNVLHWHIVDDQSFPYQSREFPGLSAKGAFNSQSVYTQSNVRQILLYARNRGIRIIPEFDTPGHVRAWAEGQPGLVTECYESGKPTGQFANIDPTKEKNKVFLKAFFGEISSTFYDDLIHIGGDEVAHECWNKNPDVVAYMEKEKISNYSMLASNYIDWLTETLVKRNKTVVAWEDVLTSKGSSPPRNVVIHNWISDPSKQIPQIVKAGYRALMSNGWYLDHVSVLWSKMYSLEPTTSDMTAEEKKRVLGGEACMWAETVDSTNIHSRIWPRTAAVAERLWSPLSALNVKEAERRIEELTCRLRRRSIPASPPNGPGYCLL